MINVFRSKNILVTYIEDDIHFDIFTIHMYIAEQEMT